MRWNGKERRTYYSDSDSVCEASTEDETKHRHYPPKKKINAQTHGNKANNKRTKSHVILRNTVQTHSREEEPKKREKKR